MRRKILLVLVLAIGVIAAACSEGEDLSTFNSKMFNTSMSSFTSQWKAKNAEVMGYSASEITRRWNTGHGLLDTQKQKDYWFDTSTDFCSSSPDTGLYFDFKAPCVRHDFGWRNLKKLDRHWNCAGSSRDHPCSSGAYGRYWNTSNKRVVNSQFLSDMNAHCATRSIFYRQACYDTAAVYYSVVSLAS